MHQANPFATWGDTAEVALAPDIILPDVLEAFGPPQEEPAQETGADDGEGGPPPDEAALEEPAPAAEHVAELAAPVVAVSAPPAPPSPPSFEDADAPSEHEAPPAGPAAGPPATAEVVIDFSPQSVMSTQPGTPATTLKDSVKDTSDEHRSPGFARIRDADFQSFDELSHRSLRARGAASSSTTMP